MTVHRSCRQSETDRQLTRSLALLIGISFLSSAMIGCNQKTNEPDGDSRPPVSWIGNDPSEWPQVLLSNYAEFEGHTTLQGASSFLVKNENGVVLAITARHLLHEDGGVRPPVSVSRINDVLKVWALFPRDKPDQFVRLRGVTLSNLSYADAPFEEIDFVVLDLAEEPPHQFEPLRIRESPIQVGEKVYLFGVPYDEPGGQNVYSGTVTERKGTRFRYDISPSANIRGFSGAPIIDSKGFVVGLMANGWFWPKMDGDKYLEAGGCDIGLVYQDIMSRKLETSEANNK